MTRALAGASLLSILPWGSLGQDKPALPAFEVASVKPATPPNLGRAGVRIGGRRGGPLEMLVIDSAEKVPVEN